MNGDVEVSGRGSGVRVPGWLRVQQREIAKQPGPYFEYRNFKGEKVRVQRRGRGLSGGQALVEILRRVR